MTRKPASPITVAVIGGGPAGLMAAEVLIQGGVKVDLYDGMPSVGRKFLVAGKGGLNLTHSEPREQFLARYGARRPRLEPFLSQFGPDELRHWAAGLGVETFVGTSGRVFPAGMKAAPLLYAWRQRLAASGLTFHPRHKWLGWNADQSLRFDTPEGEKNISAEAVILALGGGSWARLGSTGTWTGFLSERGVEIAPFKPSNCGFDVKWTEHFRTHFDGQPLKSVVITFTNSLGVTFQRQGEFIVTRDGLEGSLIYALSAPIRDEIEAAGSLLWEFVAKADFADPHKLAAAIKALPVTLIAPRPLDEAISSAGGVVFEALDERLMLRSLPGVFCAGEMLDWEAPTGGYLLTACFATGRAAGLGALAWLKSSEV
ncbi:MAG: TIGR03862 family flavoprotein [Chloroflexi bacterium]|nr:TIGR03862 family flavoprotein [Chloroflexota bacterium]